MDSAPEVIPGWYGKVPFFGDFASRRLPQQFISAWDSWLQNSMTASRGELGPNWLDIYLLSPVWRFVLLPDVIDQNLWTGLIMPSVDKVGRHFPLTIALSLKPHPTTLAAVIAAQNWFATLEEASLATLNTEFSVQQLDSMLAATPFPNDAAPRLDSRTCEFADWWQNPSVPFHLALSTLDSLPHAVSTTATRLLESSGRGKSLWWCKEESSGSARLSCFKGFPAPEFYATLLQGHRILSHAATC